VPRCKVNDHAMERETDDSGGATHALGESMDCVDERYEFTTLQQLRVALRAGSRRVYVREGERRASVTASAAVAQVGSRLTQTPPRDVQTESSTPFQDH
jgi:hypothetical protein